MSTDDNAAVPIQQKIHKILKILAAESMTKRRVTYLRGYAFGPFIPVKKNVKMCNRCHLFVPSAQTGYAICLATGWCEACTRMPPYVAGDTLRKCLSQRDESSRMEKSK